MNTWTHLAPQGILALGSQALNGVRKLYKGAYRGEKSNDGACLMGAIGLGLGQEWRGDHADDLPPWYADPQGYEYSSLAVALGHLADECRKHLDHHTQIELMGRIGVGPLDDPLDGTPGDAFDRACIAAHNDGRFTSKNGAIKALRNAASAAGKDHR